MPRLTRNVLLLLALLITISLTFLEAVIGLVTFLVPILLFLYLYLARPKFLNQFSYWKKILAEKGYLPRFVGSLVFLSLAYVIWFFLSRYVEATSGPPLPDIILDSLEPINLGLLVVPLNRLCAAAIIMYPIFIRPTKAPFVLKAISLLLVIRAIAMSLTHLGLPVGRIPDEASMIHVEAINISKDLFFSGHVSFAFMGYLLLRKDKIVNYFLLTSTLVLSFAVLAMHLHYTIDVIAAFFFTYGAYMMAAYFFRKDYRLYNYAAKD